MRRWSGWLIVVASAGVLACGTNDKTPEGGDSGTNIRTERDAGGGDDDGGGAGEPDASTDGGDGSDASDPDPDMQQYVPGECGEETLLDTTIPIDSGMAGQLYARAAWDGTGVWIVYNHPETDGGPEEIYAARIACDGTLDVEPTRISSGDGARNYMPNIASRNGVTHIVWVTQPEGQNPNTIHLTSFEPSGEQRFSVAPEITPMGGEDPISGLAWEPDVAVFDDGSGVLAVSAATGEEFQTVLQRFDRNGQLDGPGFFPHTEKGVDQKRPTVAANSDGTIHVAWTRYKAADPEAGTPEEPDRVVLTSVPAGATTGFPETPVSAKPLTNPNPIGRLAKEPGPDGQFFLGFQVTTNSRADILVRDGSSYDTAESGTFGSAGFVNFRPSVAGGDAMGALAWYRYDESPLRNDVVVQPFTVDGANILPGAELPIPMENPGIPPYGPDVTWTGNSTYFVVWSEGSSAPETRVMGRFVRFE
jgi:hypothetical protein